jgi:hypothetical protein
MASTQDQAFISQFSDNVHQLVREGASKLRAVLPTEMAKGEKHFFERIDKLTVSELTSINSSVTATDPAHSRRMATVRRYAGRVLLDDLNKLKMLIDPTSEYVKALADAHGENYDLTLYNAMLGTASTGKDGSGSQAFDTSNQQIAHGSAGLTVAKFNQALRILEANEIDIDRVRLYCAMGALAVEDLLGDSSNNLTSFDFQDQKPLATGKMPNFRGVNIIRTQRVPDETADTTYRALLFTDDVMKTAITHDLDLRIDERNDLAHVQQVTAYMMFGSVRMEEKKVVDILYQ